MAQPNIRGITESMKSMDRDELIKRPGARFKEALTKPKNARLFMFALCALCYLARVGGVDFLIPIFAFCMAYMFFLKQLEDAPIQIPIQDQLMDRNNPDPKGNPQIGEGIFYLGTRFGDGKEVWISDSDCRQHFLVLGTTGAGKAIDVNSRIMTPDGWVRAGNLRQGDVISTPFGESAVVKGVYPQGPRQMMDVIFADRAACVDNEHLWEVNHPSWAEPRILRTSDIKVLTENGDGYTIIIPKPVEHKEIACDAYDLGVRVRLMEDGGDCVSSSDIEKVETGSIRQRKDFLRGVAGVNSHFDVEQIRTLDIAESCIEAVCSVARSLGAVIDMSDGSVNLLFGIDLEIVGVNKTKKTRECVCFYVDHPRHLFIMSDYIATHNTELLMGFAANAISWGSGLIFVDGKGDVKTMAMMLSLAKKWGRECDFLVLNFMSKDDELAPGEIISNTMNPYTTAAPDDIINQLGGLTADGSGDGMWKERAMSLIGVVIQGLCWGRDHGKIELSLANIRHYVQLRNLSTMLDGDDRFTDLPESIKTELRIYMSSLGSYDFSKPGDKQGEDVVKQHGFLEMQWTGPLGSLAKTYGSIFNTDYGEVDMFDVVLNRRILIAMLPALKKMPDEVERMGKIIVASLKSMMGSTLGNIGNISDASILDTVKLRVTTAPYPCLIVLDEVGYYTVNGMAMMAAQARSLGFSMIYASQDLKAMTRNNEKEAQSIIANTNIKVIMRTEDKDSTDLAVAAGGRGARVRAKGYRMNEDGGDRIFGNVYDENREYAIEFEDRLNALDLKGQKTGHFTVMFSDILVRGQSFYTDIFNSYKDQDRVKVSPNQFLDVRKPEIDGVNMSRRLPEICDRLGNLAAILEARAAVDKELEENRDQVSDAGVLMQAALEINGPKSLLKDRSCEVIGGLAINVAKAVESFGSIVRERRSGQAAPIDDISSEFEGDDVSDVMASFGSTQSAPKAPSSSDASSMHAPVEYPDDDDDVGRAGIDGDVSITAPGGNSWGEDDVSGDDIDEALRGLAEFEEDEGLRGAAAAIQRENEVPIGFGDVDDDRPDFEEDEEETCPAHLVEVDFEGGVSVQPDTIENEAMELAASDEGMDALAYLGQIEGLNDLVDEAEAKGDALSEDEEKDLLARADAASESISEACREELGEEMVPQAVADAYHDATPAVENRTEEDEDGEIPLTDEDIAAIVKRDRDDPRANIATLSKATMDSNFDEFLLAVTTGVNSETDKE